MRDPRGLIPALVEGRLAAAGGSASGSTSYVNTVYSYTPATDLWR